MVQCCMYNTYGVVWYGMVQYRTYKASEEQASKVSKEERAKEGGYIHRSRSGRPRR